MAISLCWPSQDVVPLQPKLIQALIAAVSPLPPSPAALSQPFTGTTDWATALSSLSQTDLGNGFTEIQPRQIKEVLFRCTASLKELAVCSWRL